MDYDGLPPVQGTHYNHYDTFPTVSGTNYNGYDGLPTLSGTNYCGGGRMGIHSFLIK